MLDEVASKGLDPTKADNRILAAALGQRSHGPAVVVSNDAALRIKAAQVGLEAIEHQRRRRGSDDRRPTGWTSADVSAELIDRLFSEPGGIDLAELVGFDAEAVRSAWRSTSSPRCAPAASRCSCATATPQLVPLVRPVEAWGLRPRSKEQQFALDLLLDPEVTVVALDGMAGTGKTILALAAGLEQVMETQQLRQAQRLPTGRPGRQGRARASCPATSTRSSTRG